MVKPSYTISRRTFIRTSAHLLVLVTTVRVRWPTSTTIVQASSRFYGTGVYGRGPYSGSYRTYIALAKKQGD
jgi:hypothetical protein